MTALMTKTISVPAGLESLLGRPDNLLLDHQDSVCEMDPLAYSELQADQRIIEAKGFLGSVIRARLFDVGSSQGCLAASAHLHRTPEDPE